MATISAELARALERVKKLSTELEKAQAALAREKERAAAAAEAAAEAARVAAENIEALMARLGKADEEIATLRPKAVHRDHDLHSISATFTYDGFGTFHRWRWRRQSRPFPVPSLLYLPCTFPEPSLRWRWRRQSRRFNGWGRSWGRRRRSWGRRAKPSRRVTRRSRLTYDLGEVDL